MKWLFICGAVLLLMIGASIWLARGWTIYILRDRGYTAISTGRVRPHQADRDQFRTVIKRFLPGDLFDQLWISWADDEYTGFMLTLEKGSPRLSVDFKTHSEQAKLISYQKSMQVFHYPMRKDSNGFSGGTSEEYRITIVECDLPRSEEAIVNAVDVALSNLHGSVPSFYYLKASLFAHGPGSGSGIKLRPVEDPLSGVLGGT